MKIKTKLTISVIITIILAIVVGTVIISTSQQLTESRNNVYLAEQLLKGTFELNLITYDYLTHNEERAIIQWNLKYDSISELLLNEKIKQNENEIVLKNICQKHEDIKLIFSRIVEAKEKKAIGNNVFIEQEELERRLTSQLFVLSYDMVSSATELVDVSISQEQAFAQRAKWIIISLILMMTGVISVTLFLFNKTVINPVMKLHEGTEIIGKGNMDYRLNYDSDDEIGNLSMAFDGMLDKLKIITTSRDELNREIEARKKSEEEVRLHSEIVKNMTEGVYLVGFEDIIIRYANPKFEEMFGYNSGEMIGKHASIVNAPTDKDPVETAKEIMDTIYKTGEWQGEIENIKKDGTHFWCYATVSVIDTTKYGKVLVSVHTDITERKQMEDKLLKNQYYLTKAQEIGVIGTWELDIQKNILRWTDESYKIFGVPLGTEMNYELFLNCIHPDDRDYVGKKWSAALNKEPYDIEHRLLVNDKVKWVREKADIEFDTEGNPIMAIGFTQDISDRKKLEELVIENQSLALSDKMKSEFLSTMSHELRTPLNASIGFSELLKIGKAGELNKKQGKFVDNILNSNKHLLNLIEEILDLNKIEAGKMKLNIGQASLPELIDETFHRIEVLALKRNVVLKTKLDPELDVIECDVWKLKQILINLLNNAIKFSKDEGGTVTITTVKDGETARISVSDTGIGIKEENIEKLFAPFKQLDMSYSRKYEGTGLGLAITKKRVELHGGELSVESKFGEGSTFTFTLPITRSTHESSEAQE